MKEINKAISAFSVQCVDHNKYEVYHVESGDIFGARQSLVTANQMCADMNAGWLRGKADERKRIISLIEQRTKKAALYRPVVFDRATGKPLCAVWQSQLGGDCEFVAAIVPGEKWQVEPPVDPYIRIVSAGELLRSLSDQEVA